VSESAMPKVEVATYDGAPVVKLVWRIEPPVDEATRANVLAEFAYRMSPAVYEEMPVPPFAAVSAEARVSAPVEEKDEVAVAPKAAEYAEIAVAEAFVVRYVLVSIERVPLPPVVFTKPSVARFERREMFWVALTEKELPELVRPVPAVVVPCQVGTPLTSARTWPFEPAEVVAIFPVPFPRRTVLETIEATPVPPYGGVMTVPFQVPEVIVPTEASDERVVTDELM